MSRFFKFLLPLFIVLVTGAIFGLNNQNTSAQTSSFLVCGNAPSDVILDIDRSGSMNDSAGGTVTKINAAKTASNNFIDILANDPNNRAGIVSYATTSTLNQTLTNNFQLAKNAVTSLSASGNTCIECGVYNANQDILGNKRNNVKNAVILLSDGKANVIRGSTSKVGTSLAEEKALEEVALGHANSGTIFFTIGLGTDINSDFLKEIASVTGGKYYASPTTDQLNSVYQEISQIIAEGSVSGIVFNDLNGNGTQDAGETNLEGFTLQLSKTGEPTKSLATDLSGGYTFRDLCDGAYTLTLTPKTGWEQTSPVSPGTYSLNLTGGASLTNNDFGVKASPSPTPVPQCVENLPTLVVIPDTIVGAAEEEKVFDVKVTNNDSQACQPSTFNISGIVFNYPLWDVTLDQSEFILSPGEVGTTKMRVIPPSDEEDGPKTITVITQEAGGVQLTQNVHYVVENPAPTPTESPTFTPTPTVTPSLTPSPSPVPDQTSLSLVIGADGIGTTPRIPLGGNKNPLRPQRTFLVSIFDASDNSPVFSAQQTFTYTTASERFEGGFNLPVDFQTGTYNVYVEGPQYLRTQFPGSATITQGQVRNLTSINFNLIAGDINKVDQSFNSIDLLDYNVLISCSIYSQSSDACDVDPNYKTWSDLNDDGIVDEDDYTLWLKELANQPGSPLP